MDKSVHTRHHNSHLYCVVVKMYAMAPNHYLKL